MAEKSPLFIAVSGLRRHLRDSLSHARVFEITEVKRLILLDRAADRRTVLIFACSRNGPRTVEEILRIQIVVADVLIEHAVNLIGACFGRDVNLGAGTPAELRRVRARLNLKLLYSFGRNR